MRFGGRRTSDNVEFRGEGGGGRFGFGGGGGGGGMLLGFVFSRFGILGVIVLVGLGFLLGGDPLGLGGGGGQQTVAGSGPTGQSAAQVCQSDPTYRYACQTLASTEEQWAALLSPSGRRYEAPRMVLYRRGTVSGCGNADSRMGPFYCPTDRSIYLDTAFFEELERRFAAPGDFAQAYVIAHEVGHHVQTLLGISDRIRRGQSGASETAANALQVRMELQADCLAGVWASREQAAMDPGDLEEGMTAAAAIGDDTIQRAGRGVVVPESFTHGSAAQRQQALMRGYRGGTLASCEGYTQGI